MVIESVCSVRYCSGMHSHALHPLFKQWNGEHYCTDAVNRHSRKFEDNLPPTIVPERQLTSYDAKCFCVHNLFT